MYYFVYHIHTIALYWQEKSTLLTNENKRIDNPLIEIVKCVAALEMKTCFESPQNTNSGPNFSIYTILSYWIGRYRQKKSFRYTAKIGLWQIFQLLIFILSRGKCYYQSHWIRNVRFFFPYFGFLSFLGKFDRHCLKVIRILRIFSGHNPTNDLELITVKALPFIHQPDRVARKASDARAADWRYQTHVKKYRIFSRVFTALFRAGNHFITPQFIFKLSREWNIQSKRKKIVFFFMVLCSCFLCHYVELTRFTFSEPEPWRSDGQTSECYHVESTRLCVLGPKTGHETMVTLFNLPPSFSFTPFVQILKSCQPLKHFFFRAY